MRRFRRLDLCLLLLAGASAIADTSDPQATPEQQLQKLNKDMEELPDAISRASTAEERKQLQARWSQLPLDFLELAERYPKDPVAVEALMQALAHANGTIYPDIRETSPGSRAFALLRRDHLRSEKLGRACQLAIFGFHSGHEAFLRAVLETSPHADVQGLACLSLAQFLTDRLNRLEVLKDQDQPELLERYLRAFGKEFVDKLRAQDREPVTREIEALFARAAEGYSRVPIPVTYYGSGGTVGEKAEAELYQIRNLAIGRPAPEIVGEDQDGKPLKLSDYRGKVVLLDFWYHL
ncbi:MAG TPA: hypothetical protein VFD71_08105 [Planctomycetota bacterium]|nr:hypothetical protein [Planctomycetota bacterium]